MQSSSAEAATTRPTIITRPTHSLIHSSSPFEMAVALGDAWGLPERLWLGIMVGAPPLQRLLIPLLEWQAENAGLSNIGRSNTIQVDQRTGRFP